MWKALEKIFESASLTSVVASLVLILVGLALFLISALGAVPMTGNVIVDPWWRVALALVGLTVVGASAAKFRYASAEKEKINVREFDLKITYPQFGDTISEQYDVSETYRKKPPDGYEIEIIELNMGHGRTYRPRKRALDGPNNTWRAKDVYGGDEKTIGRERIIFVAIAGKSGQALCYYYHKVGQTYDFERRPSGLHPVRLTPA